MESLNSQHVLGFQRQGPAFKSLEQEVQHLWRLSKDSQTRIRLFNLPGEPLHRPYICICIHI